MRGALGGPRVLLRRLREVMAEPVSAQERLDKIVVLIAANMVAEVCSVYVLRVDGRLELYATEGLKPEAVHNTVLGADEGLVGLVSSEANPINLSEAQSHPAFSYRAETGEEIYHSFLGVPILRAGNTLGVLVVQNRARRTYSEEEEEALQTTAMVVAEMIASGELSAIARPGAPEPAARRPVHITGAALNDGIALGHVVLHEPRIVITNFIADDVNKEMKRLEAAIETMRSDLDLLLERGEVPDAGEHRDVLEAYRMFAYDRGWQHRLTEAVVTGLTAEAAVERVQSDTRARMLRATDPYLRERLHDLDELSNRLMHQLLGKDYAPPRDRLPENAMHRGALHGAGGAARIRPQAPARAGAGGRRPQLACRDRRARARHCRGRRDRQRHRRRRSRRRDHRRRRDRRRACAAVARHGSRLYRARAAAGAPAVAIPRAARQAVRHQGRRAGRRCCSMPGSRSTCRISRRPAPPASACSAPNCSSWWRRPCRAPPSSSRSTARCSMPPATSR